MASEKRTNSQHQSQQLGILGILRTVKLVVVMSAVNLWKLNEVESFTQLGTWNKKRNFVRIVEKKFQALAWRSAKELSSTPVNKLSAGFAAILHNVITRDLCKAGSPEFHIFPKQP